MGQAGAGKSTLVSAAASAAAARPGSGVVVIRLLGTTPATARVEGLLQGLVAELRPGSATSMPLSADVRQVIGRFGDLLDRADAARPIRLFLDAVDQLAPDRGAHELAWLPHPLPHPLPPHVHVVLSALPGTSDEHLARRGARTLRMRPLTVGSGRFLVHFDPDHDTGTAAPARSGSGRSAIAFARGWDADAAVRVDHVAPTRRRAGLACACTPRTTPGSTL